MATIDVTDNGVRFNDSSESTAEANASALEDILLNQASSGDTVLFPFTSGDVCYVEDTSETSVARIIDLDVSQGLPQNLNVRGKTDSDGKPLGKMMVPSFQSETCYMWEIGTDSGLNMKFQDLQFDHNNRGHAESGVPVVVRNMNAGAVNDLSFRNCDFRNGGGTSFRLLDANGVSFTRCTFRDADIYHGISVSQRNMAEEDARASPITFDYCLFKDNATGNGINASPGEVRVRNCVSTGNESAFKGGNENNGRELRNVYKNVRANEFTSRGYDTVFQSDPGGPATCTMENVILDGSSQTKSEELIDVSGGQTIKVPDGSKLILLDSAGDGIVVRDSATRIDVDGTIQICGSAESPYELRIDSDTDMIWDTYRHSNNGEAPNNWGNGSVTANTEETTSCQSDIQGVPTADEVGVGTGINENDDTGDGQSKGVDATIERTQGITVRVNGITKR